MQNQYFVQNKKIVFFLSIIFSIVYLWLFYSELKGYISIPENITEHLLNHNSIF